VNTLAGGRGSPGWGWCQTESSGKLASIIFLKLLFLPAACSHSQWSLSFDRERGLDRDRLRMAVPLRSSAWLSLKRSLSQTLPDSALL